MLKGDDLIILSVPSLKLMCDRSHQGLVDGRKTELSRTVVISIHFLIKYRSNRLNHKVTILSLGGPLRIICLNPLIKTLIKTSLDLRFVT